MPLTWNETADGGYAWAEQQYGESVDEALRGLRLKLKVFVLPKHERTQWDSIRVEFWSDGGRIIVYPALTGRARGERAACEARFPELQEEWNAVSNSTRSDQDQFGEEFESRIAEVELAWAKRLIERWRDDSGSDATPVEFFSGEEAEPFFIESVTL